MLLRLNRMKQLSPSKIKLLFVHYSTLVFLVLFFDETALSLKKKICNLEVLLSIDIWVDGGSVAVLPGMRGCYNSNSYFQYYILGLLLYSHQAIDSEDQLKGSVSPECNGWIASRCLSTQALYISSCFKPWRSIWLKLPRHPNLLVPGEVT